MIVVPNNGEIELLKRMFGKGINASGILQLGLIDEDIAITETTTLAEIEAVEVNTDSGDLGSGGEASYVRKNLNDIDWTISSSGDGIATHDPVVFTLDGGLDSGYNIYGYFVAVDDLGGNKQILWAEKFSSALTISASGGTVSITLKLELD